MAYSVNPDSIIDAALKLPPGKRADLAERLWLSLDAEYRREHESPWDQEIDRRIEASRRDPSRLLDGDEIVRRLETGQKP